MALDRKLERHGHELLLEPVRIERREAGPADAAGAMHFVALDREPDLLAAGIAGDDAEFRAGEIVHHRRQVARGAAFVAGAEDHLASVERVAEVLGRRVGAEEAMVDVAVGAAEIDELAGLVLDGGVAEQRLQDRARERSRRWRCRPWAPRCRCSPPPCWSRRPACSARRWSAARECACRDGAPAAGHRCRSRRRRTSRHRC